MRKRGTVAEGLRENRLLLQMAEMKKKMDEEMEDSVQVSAKNHAERSFHMA